MIITAPKGSLLSFKEDEEEKGYKNLILDASGKDKPIKAYICRPNKTVQEFHFSNKE